MPRWCTRKLDWLLLDLGRLGWTRFDEFGDFIRRWGYKTVVRASSLSSSPLPKAVNTLAIWAKTYTYSLVAIVFCYWQQIRSSALSTYKALIHILEFCFKQKHKRYLYSPSHRWTYLCIIWMHLCIGSYPSIVADFQRRLSRCQSLNSVTVFPSAKPILGYIAIHSHVKTTIVTLTTI